MPLNKRIMLWANEIDKNIKAPKCSKSCAFNHIDTSSIKIVEEISSIQKTQDLVNLQLTKLENEFDILEDLQPERRNQINSKRILNYKSNVSSLTSLKKICPAVVIIGKCIGISYNN